MQTTPRFLWFLILSYCMVMVLANWFDPRFIQLFSFNTDAGTLIFPLTFLLSAMMTEVYGYQEARLAIWCGFLFNLIFILYGLLITHLPSPAYAIMSNQHFDAMMTINIRIIVASMISYLCSETLNAFLTAKLKIKFAGRQMAMRFITSTLLASGVDSVIFGSIAFAGLMSKFDLMKFIATMWMMKVAIEIIFMPLSVALTRQLKKLEHLDVYDRKTDFNPFAL